MNLQFGAIYTVLVPHAKPEERKATIDWLKEEAAKQNLPLAAFSNKSNSIDVFTADHADIGRPMETYEAEAAQARFQKDLQAFRLQLNDRRAVLEKADLEALGTEFQARFSEVLEKKDAAALLSVSQAMIERRQNGLAAIKSQLKDEWQAFVENQDSVRFLQNATLAKTSQRRVPMIPVSEAKRWHRKGRFNLETGEYKRPSLRERAQGVRTLVNKISAAFQKNARPDQ